MTGAPTEILPQGWSAACIGDVVARDGLFVDGDWVESKDQDPSGSVRLIQLADIGDGYFMDKSARFLTKKKAYDLKCTFIQKDDLLIARMPDPLGRTCTFPFEGTEKYVTVVDVCAVRFGSSQVNGKYMMYLINSPTVRADIEALKSGSTRKRISRKNLAKIQMPLAPVNEQQRIVAKIEELFSELDKGIESLKTGREQLKVYRQAVLKYAFEGKLTEKWREENKDKLETPEKLLERIKAERNKCHERQIEEWKIAVKAWEEGGCEGRKPAKPKKPVIATDCELPQDFAEYCANHWSWLRLSDVSEVSGGLTKNQKRRALSKIMKYLRVANVYKDELRLGEIAEIGVTEDEFRKLQLSPGDLLVVEGNGSIDQIGRLAMWSGEIQEIGHQNHLIRVRLIDSVQSRFVLLFLLSPLGRKLIVKQASSTSGLHTLSISKVSGLPIPVPCVGEQEEIVRHVDRLLSIMRKMESDVTSELSRCDGLRQAVLSQAFSGQLVDQDPNDEPASELLARIKAEKEQVGKAKKASKKKIKRKTKRKDAA